MVGDRDESARDRGPEAAARSSQGRRPRQTREPPGLKHAAVHNAIYKNDKRMRIPLRLGRLGVPRRAAELVLVALHDLLDRGAQEDVLPVVVQLDHALQEGGAGKGRLSGELARAREDGLDIGGGGLLAADLGEVDGVVDGEDGLVVSPECTQVEAVGVEVVLVVEALARTGGARVSWWAIITER